jgi:hypothetical protein
MKEGLCQVTTSTSCENSVWGQPTNNGTGVSVTGPQSVQLFYEDDGGNRQPVDGSGGGHLELTNESGKYEAEMENGVVKINKNGQWQPATGNGSIHYVSPGPFGQSVTHSVGYRGDNGENYESQFKNGTLYYANGDQLVNPSYHYLPQHNQRVPGTNTFVTSPDAMLMPLDNSQQPAPAAPAAAVSAIVNGGDGGTGGVGGGDQPQYNQPSQQPAPAPGGGEAPGGGGSGNVFGGVFNAVTGGQNNGGQFGQGYGGNGGGGQSYGGGYGSAGNTSGSFGNAGDGSGGDQSQSSQANQQQYQGGGSSYS